MLDNRLLLLDNKCCNKPITAEKFSNFSNYHEFHLNERIFIDGDHIKSLPAVVLPEGFSCYGFAGLSVKYFKFVASALIAVYQDIGHQFRIPFRAVIA
jgi:hypothetical protein